MNRRSGIAALAAAFGLATVLLACTADPGGSGIPATPTLNPNQLEALRRSAGLSSPSPTMIPATASPSGPAMSDGAPLATPAPTPFDADLEAQLPASLRGLPLARFSAPASMFATGGDMCSFLCPDEPARLAAAAGMPADDITVAFAYPAPTNGLDVAVLAIRFPGVLTERLIDIRIAEGGMLGSSDSTPPETAEIQVGKRAVTRITYGPFYDPDQAEYAFASGDVLFIVVGRASADPDVVPPDVALAIGTLP